MLVIFLRAIIVFVALVIVMRLMGKRQIGEMQPFEFIITLLIAELACVPMADVSIPLIYGLAAIIAVFILHQLTTILEHLSEPFKRIVDGKPSIVIDKQGVKIAELKKNNMDVSDLMESLRGTGNFALDAVSYAIYESNGKLSVMKAENTDEDKELPLIVVAEGKMDMKNYALIGLNEKIFGEFIRSNGVKSVKNIEVMTVTASGKVYLKCRGEKFKISTIRTERTIPPVTSENGGKDG